MKEREIKKTAGIDVPFGWKDDKAIAVTLNNEDRPNMLIHGGPGSGKTTLLQNIVLNLNVMYKREDVTIAIIDAGLGSSWGKFLPVGPGVEHLHKFYCKANPSARLVSEMFDFFSAMAEFRSKSLNLSDLDDVNMFNDYADEKNKMETVVIIIDDYQRFIGTKSEKAFVRMVKAINEFGYNTDMHLIMSSQSSKGTKVALDPTVWDSFAINICLEADESVVAGTVQKFVNFKSGNYEGYYLMYGDKEPVKFNIGNPCKDKNVELIEDENLAESKKWWDEATAEIFAGLKNGTIKIEKK